MYWAPCVTLMMFSRPKMIDEAEAQHREGGAVDEADQNWPISPDAEIPIRVAPDWNAPLPRSAAGSLGGGGEPIT